MSTISEAMDALHKKVQQLDEYVDEALLDKAKELYEKYKEKFQDFLHKIEQEGTEVKKAFVMLNQSAFDGRKLTDDEKKYVEEQMKEALKTVGLVGLAALPGGSLIFILCTFLHLNKYVLPHAFLGPEKTTTNVPTDAEITKSIEQR